MVHAAKKKKKKGGGGSKKNQSSNGGVLETSPRPSPYLSTPVIMHNLLLVESYYRKTGRYGNMGHGVV